MADYNPILDAETDPEAGLRSSLFKRMVANPIAIAEGANNAPRIQPPSMAQPLVSASGQGAIGTTSWLAFTGLGDIKDLRIDLGSSASAATNPAVEVAFSADGGSSWGSSQNIISGVSFQGLQGVLRLDLESGALNGWLLISGGAALNLPNTTLTVPADCDAVRFRTNSNASGRSLAVSIMSLGGRA